MKQTTKRFLSLVLGLAMLTASLIIFFEFIQPVYGEAQGLKAQSLSLRSFVDSKSSAIKQVKDSIDAYHGQTGVQEVVSSALPTSQDLTGAVAQLYGLAQNNSLSFQGISVASSLARPSATGGEAAAPAYGSASFVFQKPIGNISFQLKLTGTYESFKAFISQLEKSLRIFDVKSIVIQPAAQSVKVGNSYNYDITVATYYQGR